MSIQKLITDDNGIAWLLTFDDAGNVVNRQEAITAPKRKSNPYWKKGGFYTVSKEYDEFLLENYEHYSKLELGVLSWLRRHIDFNNRIKTFRQKDIAERLNSDQANISRALKKLIKDEIIEKHGYDYYFTDKYIRGASDYNRRKKEVDLDEPLTE